MKKEIAIIITVLIVIIGIAFTLNGPKANRSGKYDTFATCIKNSGTIFYGAFWCPHCKAQKELFGDSVNLLPYVECSTPDGQSQLPICKEKGVQSYPTWIFADGGRLTGEVSLADLATKTNCPLPTNDVATTTNTGGTMIVASTTVSI